MVHAGVITNAPASPCLSVDEKKMSNVIPVTFNASEKDQNCARTAALASSRYTPAEANFWKCAAKSERPVNPNGPSTPHLQVFDGNAKPRRKQK